MPTLDDVKLIPRAHRSDARGWLLKVLDGREEHLPGRTGEVYLTLARPGEARGNHFHRSTDEWFTVVQGAAEAVLVDPETRARRVLHLVATAPATVYVPAGIAHVFTNEGRDDLLLVAYASMSYDPADTVPFDCK